LLSPGRSARYVIRQKTFTGTPGKARDVPIAPFAKWMAVAPANPGWPSGMQKCGGAHRSSYDPSGKIGPDEGLEMAPTRDSTLADPQQVITELQRQLAERTAGRDEAIKQQTATAGSAGGVRRPMLVERLLARGDYR
jgi:hypothetical protein